jgi:hypothetical protein
MWMWRIFRAERWYSDHANHKLDMVIRMKKTPSALRVHIWTHPIPLYWYWYLRLPATMDLDLTADFRYTVYLLSDSRKTPILLVARWSLHISICGCLRRQECHVFDSAENPRLPQWCPEREMFMPHLHSLNQRSGDVHSVNLELTKADEWPGKIC